MRNSNQPQLVHKHTSNDVPLMPQLHGFSRYATSLALAIFAAIVSDYSELHHFRLVYVPCLAASVIAALLGGMGPGIFAAILGALLTDYFVIGPGQFFKDSGALERLILYLGISIIVGMLTDRLRRAATEAQFRATENQHIVDIVSHDLRNPISSVQMYASLLLRNLSAPSTKIDPSEYLSGILRSADRMKGITGDLLAASQIEMGRFSIKPETSDLASIINDLLSAFEAEAQKRNINFEVRLFAPKIQAIVDRSRMIQAISNLVHNAEKYSPDGGTVTISAQEKDGVLRIAVSDQGPGIHPEEMGHIFDRYWTERSGPTHGTGLGLFIAKGIATSHGGDLSVANNPGGGATFTLTIPLKREVLARVA